VLAVIGQCSAKISPIYTHQILDQVALFEPVSTHVVALRPETASAQLSTVFDVLDTQRPGPVVVEVAADVATAEVAGTVAPKSETHASPPPDLTGAVQLLGGALRPVMAIGCGDLSKEAAAAIADIAEALKLPIITTYRAKGMLSEHSPWSAGAFGLSPVVDEHQQNLLSKADCLLAVGLDPVELRPNWLPGWQPSLPVISVDPYGQPDLLGNIAADLRGDVPSILRTLSEMVSGSAWTTADVARHCATLDETMADGPSGPASTLRAIQAACPTQTTVALDVGAHRITASHVWKCTEPRQLLQSNGFSSMGFGLPAAIAAKLVEPARTVVAITGDMGLWMVLGELGIAQERGLDLVVVYLSDAALSLIQLKQERLHHPSRAVQFANPKTEPLATAFGGVGVVTHTAQEAGQAVRDAIERGGLTLVEARIDADAYRQQM